MQKAELKIVVGKGSQEREKLQFPVFLEPQTNRSKTPQTMWGKFNSLFCEEGFKFTGAARNPEEKETGMLDYGKRRSMNGMMKPFDNGP